MAPGPQNLGSIEIILLSQYPIQSQISYYKMHSFLKEEKYKSAFSATCIAIYVLSRP